MQTEEIAAPPASPAVDAHVGAPRRRRFTLSRKVLFYTVLGHVLFAAVAALWIVQVNRDRPRQLTFKPIAGSRGASTHALEHKVRLKQRNLSAPPAAKRVTTTALSKVTLPPMPALDTQFASVAPAALVSGMGAAGFGVAPGMGGAAGSFGQGGGTLFMASIGGLNVQARQLAVALDVSGSIAQFQDSMQKYVAKNFPGNEVATFTWAGFTNYPGKAGSIGTVLRGFLDSPRNFDAIYVFSDFGETKGEQDAWPQIQARIREKKVRLYLHVLRAPGKEGKINRVLEGIVAFARSTGGGVKIGEMPPL